MLIGAFLAVAAAVEVAADPGPPAVPTIREIASGASTIELRFSPNLAPGSTISEFGASCTSSDGGADISGQGVGAAYGDSRHVISVAGGTIGHTYTCTLVATNAGGTSAPSAPSDAVVVGRPSAPIVYDLGVGATTVSFTALRPGDGGASGTRFIATCSSNDGGVTRATNSPSTAITVTGLTAGKTYSCAVRATNTTGAGPASDTGSFIAGRPGAPEITDIAPMAGELVPIVMAPASTGGSAITGYDATCTSTDGGTTRGATVAALPIPVTALDDGKTYTCAVRARNASGYGPAGESQSIRPGRPAAPIVGTPTFGTDYASVPFVGPYNDGGSAVISREADCTSSDGGVDASNTSVSAPITVYGLTEGATYRCTVTALNASGPGVPGGPASPLKAGRPTPVFVDSFTPGPASVSIAFRAPSQDGGSPITAYTAHCESPDGAASSSVTGPVSPLVVNGLDDGVEYSCAVYATTSEGDGADGIRFEFVIPGRATAPTITSATAAAARATIAFDEPASDGGSPITGYTASCSSNDGGATRSVDAATSPIVISGLTNGATYHCELWADADAGAGMHTDTVLTVGAVPFAPQLHALTPGNATITVSFLAPTNNGGFPVSKYTASCASSNGGVARSVSGTGTPIVVTGLTNLKTYTCRVSATTDIGAGPLSSASAPLRPGLPSAPVLQTAKASNAAITVTFAKPVSNGGFAITGYTAACYSSNGGATRTHTGTASPVKVVQLTNGKKYTCKVSARNAKGSGTSSVASAVVVPHT